MGAGAGAIEVQAIQLLFADDDGVAAGAAHHFAAYQPLIRI
jgi:hypothetical protein